ncbi:MAG TPA: AmmeMemoRadiSam system protein B [Acidimicrobiales bacterium]|nr:AmmeMemoRadiSam system protein B [Acidimicrobiales bacterium]
MKTAGRVRPPAVAGSFYPADPAELRSVVEAFVGEQGAAAKAIIAPHAGYVFSGPVAGSAYARVARGRVSRVVLLGPAHRVPDAGIAVSSADAFSTPLGLVPVDTSTRDALVDAGLVTVRDDAHASEHSLEVHLPFLQVCLGDVSVLPLAVGQVDPVRVAEVLDRAWGGEETLIVVSTDLSHYLDHATAARLDRRTAEAVVARRPDRLGPYDACGLVPLQGLLLAAERHGLEVELLDLRTSADTAGGPARVVGYGAFALA